MTVSPRVEILLLNWNGWRDTVACLESVFALDYPEFGVTVCGGVVVRRPDGVASHLDLASFRFTRTPYDPDADVPGGVDEGGWR